MKRGQARPGGHGYGPRRQRGPAAAYDLGPFAALVDGEECTAGLLAGILKRLEARGIDLSLAWEALQFAASSWPPVIVEKRGVVIVEEHPSDAIGESIVDEWRRRGPRGRSPYRVTTKGGRQLEPFAMQKRKPSATAIAPPADHLLAQLGVGGRVRKSLLSWAARAFQVGRILEHPIATSPGVMRPEDAVRISGPAPAAVVDRPCPCGSGESILICTRRRS